VIAGLPMYDWPEVADALDALWRRVAAGLRARGVDAPDALSHPADPDALWRDPRLVLGQVCSLNPVRDGLGETEVVGTLAYEPPPGLPRCAPGDYYSVVVCRAADAPAPAVAPGDTTAVEHLAGARLAANGTDSQSGYWSLGHHVRRLVARGPLFGGIAFTGSHRRSIAAVAEGHADLAAIDVHSWRLALAHEAAAAELAVIATTDPTPGVACVVSWELAHLRPRVDAALRDAVTGLAGTDVLDALHVTGYRTRRMDEFGVVADRVAAADKRPWHR
jgi:ABC-type phosphate/phosphonate transport system substrate-binding protein